MSLSVADGVIVVEFLQSIRQMLRAFDMAVASDSHTPAEARLLLAIGQRGQCRAMALAQDLSMDRGQISRLILRLVDLGQVAMQPSIDKRSSNLVLTRDGDAALARLTDAQRRAAEVAISLIDESQHTKLLAAMARIHGLSQVNE